MSLVDEYKRQFGWRSWPAVFDALASLQGQTVLDLGCGVGDLAAEFVARGARVIGVDLNADLLAHARSRRLAGAEFRIGDLRVFLDLEIAADGLWCSFGGLLPGSARGTHRVGEKREARRMDRAHGS